ncbi:MAG TPA: BsuPI-related putative proteinase inhibitor [Longimicrobium sp.]|nr:BsuPI-related putative proteinase inhibitor [Longimicrobium sp.]
MRPEWTVAPHFSVFTIPVPMRPVLAVAAMAFISAACRPPAAAPAPQPSGEAAGNGAPLVVTLQTDAAADSVRFTLQVTNASAQPVTLRFSSGQSYDFTVRDGAAEVWRWSGEMMFTQALRAETLAPGETRGWSETWRPAATLRGHTLTATARLTSTSHPVERAQTFRLP